MEMEEPEVVVVEEYFVEEDKAIETEEKEVDLVAQPSSCRSQLFVTLSQLEKIKTILKTEKESIKMIKEEGIDFFKLFGSYEKNPLVLRSMFETLELYIISLKDLDSISHHLKVRN